MLKKTKITAWLQTWQDINAEQHSPTLSFTEPKSVFPYGTREVQIDLTDDYHVGDSNAGTKELYGPKGHMSFIQINPSGKTMQFAGSGYCTSFPFVRVEEAKEEENEPEDTCDRCGKNNDTIFAECWACHLEQNPCDRNF